jgi:hypothetical protein
MGANVTEKNVLFAVQRAQERLSAMKSTVANLQPMAGTPTSTRRARLPRPVKSRAARDHEPVDRKPEEAQHLASAAGRDVG